MELDENLANDVSLTDRDGEGEKKNNKPDSSSKYALQIKLLTALAEQFSTVLQVGGIRAIPYMQVCYGYFR